VVTRGVDVDVLPFSAGQSLAETDGVFERMMQNPELTSERIELGSFVVEYTAKDALEASGDQPTLIYGMSQLKSSGFETARVQAEVFEALSFALQANCVARGENQAKGDGLCTLMINSGLLKSAPPATVPRYKVLRLEDWGEARNAGGKPEHIERLLDWGRSRLADPN
jgi:hypothetical protein